RGYNREHRPKGDKSHATLFRAHQKKHVAPAQNKEDSHANMQRLHRPSLLSKASSNSQRKSRINGTLLLTLCGWGRNPFSVAFISAIFGLPSASGKHKKCCDPLASRRATQERRVNALRCR